MVFLDELGKKLTQTSQDVVQKTKETAEVLKYSSMISDEERNLEKLYAELGKSYFEAHIDSYEEAYASTITNIKEAQSKIKEYETEIQQIKGLFPCPNCGTNLQSDSLFCSNCGTKIEKPEAPAPAENTTERLCSKCGSPISDEYAFCINCGTKIEAEVTNEENNTNIL